MQSLPADLLTATQHVAEGRLAKAEAVLRQYVFDNPADVNGIRMLGEVGMSLGALRESHALLERCLELAPDYHAARYAYANVLYKQHRYEAAIAQLDSLLKFEPANPAWLTLKAANLVEINEHSQAIPLFEQVINTHPEQAQAQLSYGHSLRAIGNTDGAIAAYLRATEQGHGVGEAYWSLANLKTFKFSDAQIADIESRLNNEDCVYRDYYHLLFALGKAQEDRGAHHAAMAAYLKANQVRGKAVPWDSGSFHQDIETLCDFFSAEFLASRAGTGCLRNDPIFIVGLPRAGSTLIEQILASHSQVEGTAELAEVIRIARTLSAKQRREDASQYPTALAAMGNDELEKLGEAYLTSTAVQRTTQCPRFIDKMPNNFTHIGLIHMILPNATIIDARRHPMDCCFSGFKQLFASGQGFSYGLKRIGYYYRDYVKVMDHWNQALPGKVLRVDYESMVADPEAQIRRLLAHCELPFEAQCLNFHETQRTVRTASSEQVRQPIYRSGLNQWQPFSQWLDPLREALGPVLETYSEASGHLD
jgi:tetratricopeptide (TPR) repeat protein